MAKESKIINDNNNRENAKRVQYDYEVSHYTYILRDGNYRKLEGDKLRLFIITQMHTNGSTEAVVLHTGAPTVHWEDNKSCIYVVEAKRVTHRIKKN